MPLFNQPDGPVYRNPIADQECDGMVIVAESGADLSKEQIKTYGIHVVPMHVNIEGVTRNDGEFPVEDIFESFDRTGKIPTTSCTSPGEYSELFEELRARFPKKNILHLCYSACTTATWQSALLASEDLDGIIHIDTRQVSGGQGAVILKTARYLLKHPGASLEETVAAIQSFIRRSRFVFMPHTLDYLRAGGRVSNAAYLGANLFHLKPSIEIQQGQLISAKKYHGRWTKMIERLLHDQLSDHQFEEEGLFLVYGERMDPSVRQFAEECVKSLGYTDFYWVRTGGTISCHGGPGAFGVGGFVKE